jgi:hypothetical protein
MNHNEKPKGVAGSNGTTSFELGKGWMALETVILVKCLDPEGNIRYREMTSSTLHPVEALGMCETFADTLRARLMNNARPYED